MKQIILTTIRWYQRYVSPDTGVFRRLYGTSGSCRFIPTCSEYTYQAIDRYGILSGTILGFQRIIRCHPWNPGGSDPIPGHL